MLYAAICTDKPGSLDKRKANRPEHLAYLKGLGDALVLAGPFTEEDGTSMNGSLIVVEAASQAHHRRSLRQGRHLRERRDPPLAVEHQQTEQVSAPSWPIG